MSVSGFEFGQSERLTIRLKGLIRSYPRGIGLLKEFIQNADDAAATQLTIVMDWRLHAGTRLPDARMQRVMGPALLLANNRRFSGRDLTAIRHIGESSKLTSGPKTGRFGLGFNTSYNVTDYPSFLTNNAIYCFDPHQNAAAVAPGFGKGWELDKLWKSAPDWPGVFEAAGLERGAADYDGTIFRLPLRSMAQAAESEICDEPYVREDFGRLVEQAIAVGPELLLFTKSLAGLSIDEIDENGARIRRLEVQTVNADEVEAERSAIRAAFDGDLAARLAEWRTSKNSLPLATYTHRFTVRGDQHREESWAVANGFARGAKDLILDAAQEMLRHEEKALPWVGAAARIDEVSRAVQPIEGRLYCGLPLSVPVKLPVHINGYFDLDASRQKLTVATGHGDAAAALTARVRWNEALVEEGASWVWSRLLRALAEEHSSTVYSVWPDLGTTDTPLLARLASAVYKTTAGWSLIRVRSGDSLSLAAPRNLKLPPGDWYDDLFEPLCADGLPLPDPPLPPHLELGFKEALTTFTPAMLRERLRVEAKLGVKLESAPRACLRQRPWIVSLLRYCLSDKAKALSQLPLAISCDGQLQAFGFYALYIATDDEREIFKRYPYWFIDPAFQRETGLEPAADAKLIRMRPADVVTNLRHVLSAAAPCPWQPDDAEVPNRKWLGGLLHYLSKAELSASSSEQLKNLPLVPGSDGKLYAPGRPDTPLLASAEEDRAELLAVLRALDVPVVESEFQESCRRFAAARPGLLTVVSGPGLVSALHARRARLAGLDTDSAALLLDFLAEARWTYKDSVLRQLRELPILPTETTAISASEPQVYLPTDFEPRALSLQVHLLLRADRWRALYQRMEIPPLDAWRYLREVLLPALPSLPEAERVRALRWIRDSQLVRLMDLEEQSTREKVSSAVAVQASDGTVRAINQLHDPKSALIRDVLGDAALLPDMDVYADRPAHWLRFFRELGMAETPRPLDIVEYIKRLIPQGRSAREALKRVFDFIKVDWEKLSTLSVVSGRSTVRFSRMLAELSFLPALQESPHPGFLAPEPRLYRPDELALDVDLVGSKAPVCEWGIPAALTKDLNFRRTPDLMIVLRHLEHLLDLWESEGHGGVKAEAMGSALSTIYTYMGRFQEAPSRDGDAAFVLSPQARAILKQLQGRPCLWDPESKRLWLPEHVFAVPVPYFEPRRTTIDPVPRGVFNHALDLLGRRREPAPADYIGFLSELQADQNAGSPRLTEDERKQALNSLQALAEEAQLPRDLPLLTRDGGLAPAYELLQDDAPWLKERTQNIRVVASEVPLEILSTLGVEYLSDCVEERLVEGSREPIEPSAQDVCRRLQVRLRLPSFLSGLRRLVRHHHGIEEEPEFSNIKRLRLQPVATLITEVILSDGRSLGRLPVRHYFDPEENVLFAVNASKSRIVPMLARTLSWLLAKLAPPDLAPLEHILNCDDEAEIAECLDEDRITELIFEEENIEWHETADPAGAIATKEEINQSRADSELASDSSSPELAVLNGSPSAWYGDGAGGGGWIPHPGSSHGSANPGSASVGRMEHLIRGLLDAPSRKDPEALWGQATERGQLSEPGSGHSLIERSGSGGGILRIDPNGTPDGMTDAERQSAERIEEAALTYVLEFEVRANRTPQRMPRDFPGYDIRSQGNAADEVRYIQVKGLSRDWRDRPVELRPAQMESALQFRQRSWLYIVERLEGTPRLHRICDVASLIGHFRIDAVWAAHAEGAPTRMEPAEGGLLFEGSARLGQIESIRTAGELRRLTLLRADGTKTTISYKPGVHRVEPPDGADET